MLPTHGDFRVPPMMHFHNRSAETLYAFALSIAENLKSRRGWLIFSQMVLGGHLFITARLPMISNVKLSVIYCASFLTGVAKRCIIVNRPEARYENTDIALLSWNSGRRKYDVSRRKAAYSRFAPSVSPEQNARCHFWYRHRVVLSQDHVLTCSG